MIEKELRPTTSLHAVPRGNMNILIQGVSGVWPLIKINEPRPCFAANFSTQWRR